MYHYFLPSLYSFYLPHFSVIRGGNFRNKSKEVGGFYHHSLFYIAVVAAVIFMEREERERHYTGALEVFVMTHDCHCDLSIEIKKRRERFEENAFTHMTEACHESLLMTRAWTTKANDNSRTLFLLVSRFMLDA
jgi:hypothetical protein